MKTYIRQFPGRTRKITAQHSLPTSTLLRIITTLASSISGISTSSLFASFTMKTANLVTVAVTILLYSQQG